MIGSFKFAVEALVVCLVGILPSMPGTVSGRPSARLRAYGIGVGVLKDSGDFLALGRPPGRMLGVHDLEDCQTVTVP